MADNQVQDLGKYARHPRRTAGAAFLIGMGAGMMAAAKTNHRPKSRVQKFMDQLGL